MIVSTRAQLDELVTDEEVVNAQLQGQLSAQSVAAYWGGFWLACLQTVAAMTQLENQHHLM